MHCVPAVQCRRGRGVDSRRAEDHVSAAAFNTSSSVFKYVAASAFHIHHFPLVAVMISMVIILEV